MHLNKSTGLLTNKGLLQKVAELDFLTNLKVSSLFSSVKHDRHEGNQSSFVLRNLHNKGNQTKLFKKINSICQNYSFSNVRFYFTSTKDQQNTQNTSSSHLSTLLSQPKQNKFILNLFNSFQKQSQQLNHTFQSNLQFINPQQFNKILTSLNTLTQNFNLFLLELQIQQMSQIDKWKFSGQEWSGKLKQQRQNILIEIQQRKLFYKRLQSFLSNITKQFQILFQSQNHKHLSEKKNNLQVKSSSKLVQGDFFKLSFLTDNYQQIYDQVSKSKQDYLLKSRKLKGFNLLKVNDYESNYAIKLRLMIQILSSIKHIYQLFLINQSKKLSIKQLDQKYVTLNAFLSNTIISPEQYEELIRAYFNQFSQQNIKNFMFMSVGYHSPQISQLSKQLIDVKIKQTLFDYDVQNLSSFYLIQQNQWLYNSSASHSDYSHLQSDKNHDAYHFNFEQDQKKNQKFFNFQNNKEIILNYAKLVLKELNKVKKQNLFHNRQQISQIDQMDESFENTEINPFSQQKISFNQLLPHNFFNITDVMSFQSLIQQQIIPLMVNPYLSYQHLILKKSKDLQKCAYEIQKKLVQSQYLKNLRKFLRDLNQNMHFLCRFNEWNINMIVHIKNLLQLFYTTEMEKIQKEVSHLLNEKQAFSQIQTPYLMVFFRIINIIYNVNNHINPIYIEDFIDSTDFMAANFNQFIKQLLCEKNSVSPVQLFGLFDKVLLNFIQKQKNTSDGISATLLRFRVLSVLLDSKIIKYQEFFKILLDEKAIQHFKMINEDLQTNALLSFLLHSEGFQKCLRIYSQFYAQQKDQFKELLQKLPHFSEFSSIILHYQNSFNQVLNNLEFFQDPSNIEQKSFKKQEKTKKNKERNTLPQLLQFYEQNDLIHRSQFTDQELYINWLDKIFLNSKSIIVNESNTSLSLKELQNPLKILTHLSQNTSFLSSTMNLSYFGYAKHVIGQLHAFQKFQSSWNYPFLADIAIGKNRFKGKKVVNEKFYIQTLPTSGIQGRGRFFKEQTSLKRNFMNFIDLTKNKDEQNLITVQTRRYFYGVRTEDYSVIQLRISIQKGQQLINTVRQWLQDRFEIVETKRNNMFDPQQYK